MFHGVTEVENDENEKFSTVPKLKRVKKCRQSTTEEFEKFSKVPTLKKVQRCRRSRIIPKLKRIQLCRNRKAFLYAAEVEK